MPGAALGTGDTFKLNVSDISRNGRSLAHILSGTILIVPVTFMRESNEQNNSKSLAGKDHVSAVHMPTIHGKGPEKLPSGEGEGHSCLACASFPSHVLPPGIIHAREETQTPLK